MVCITWRRPVSFSYTSSVTANHITITRKYGKKNMQMKSLKLIDSASGTRSQSSSTDASPASRAAALE